MNAPKAHRRLDPVQHRRHEFAAIDCLLRFLARPARGDGRLRPQHDGAARQGEFRLDHFIEGLAGRDDPIPPHAPAAPFERFGDKGGDCPVMPRIADETVRHRLPRGDQPREN
jgi:hypothetical protein